MNLTETAASLLDQYPDGNAFTIRKQERRLERFGQIAFGGFGLVVASAVAGIVYWIITKMVLTGENFWGGLLLVAFMIFAALTLTYVVLRESLNEKKQKLNTQLFRKDVGALHSAPAASEIDVQVGMSVVDDTTELLPAKEKTRKLN